MFKNDRRGFTLVELMVVISIIGILSVLSIVSLNNAQQGSRDTQRKAQVLNIQSALERYRTVNGTYAPQWNAARNYACGGSVADQINGSGLGNTCFFNVNHPNPVDGGKNDPLFITDPTTNSNNPTPAQQSGYLLAYMPKPAKLSNSIPSGKGNFLEGGGVASNPDFSTGVINYKVQNSYYVVRVVLEKQSTSVTTGANCNGNTDGYFVAATNVWKELIYAIPNATNTCSDYKVFQRSNLSASTP